MKYRKKCVVSTNVLITPVPPPGYKFVNEKLVHKSGIVLNGDPNAGSMVTYKGMIIAFGADCEHPLEKGMIVKFGKWNMSTDVCEKEVVFLIDEESITGYEEYTDDEKKDFYKENIKFLDKSLKDNEIEILKVKDKS